MKINTNKEYKKALHDLYQQMSKGESNISDMEAKGMRELAEAIEYYEDNILQIMPLPVTIENIVASKMHEMDITQYALAELLNIGTPKLSQILNGKRKPDVAFLKAVHEKLQIDGNLLLEKA